jgi:hypothetical protein
MVDLRNSTKVSGHLSSERGWNHVTSYASSRTFLQELALLMFKKDGKRFNVPVNAMRSIRYENNSLIFQVVSSPSPPLLIFDLFVDKTFLWDKDAQKTVYKEPWIGVIHHPANVQGHPCRDLFLSENFKESLSSCLSLIVLSRHLRDQLRQLVSHCELEKFPNIFVLDHPVPLFSTPIVQRKRVLIHIGQHGRRVEDFYRIHCPHYKKYLLTNDYFFPQHLCGTDRVSKRSLIKKLFSQKGEVPYIPGHLYMHNLTQSRSPIPDPFHPRPRLDIGSAKLDRHGMLIFPQDCKHDKCFALPRLTSSQYEYLLQQSVVYIYLEDASAVNTILECIFIATPIIVNDHPAVVEVLGKSYPLYANSVDAAEMLLQDPDTIKNAEIYMKNIDKDRWNVKHFLDGVKEIIFQSHWKEKIISVNTELEATPPSELLPEGGKIYKEAFDHFHESQVKSLL